MGINITKEGVIKKNLGKRPENCDKCKALNKFIFNHYGIYYCWEKKGKKISEGKDTLPIPTPGWCPREV